MSYAQPINRNTAYHTDNPALTQIVTMLESALVKLGCPIRFRGRPGKACTVLRVSTQDTNHILRFSVLDRNPKGVHMQAQCFVSPYENPARAGWRGARTVDFRTGDGGLLLPSDLAVIINQAREWLALDGDNARTPRAQFLVQNGIDKAPSRWVAASFIARSVNVGTEGGYHLVLADDSRGLRTTIRGDAAQAFDAPASLVGCRVVIHHDGVTRVLGKSLFEQLYRILD